MDGRYHFIRLALEIRMKKGSPLKYRTGVSIQLSPHIIMAVLSQLSIIVLLLEAVRVAEVGLGGGGRWGVRVVGEGEMKQQVTSVTVSIKLWREAEKERSREVIFAVCTDDITRYHRVCRVYASWDLI
jgi:hypothetical protein